MSSTIRDRAMLDTGRDHEQLAGSKRHRFGAFHLDRELAVPAEEQFILIMVMPRELAFQPGDADNGIVDESQIDGLPWSSQGSYRLDNRNRSLFHVSEISDHASGRAQLLPPANRALISLQVGHTG